MKTLTGTIAPLKLVLLINELLDTHRLTSTQLAHQAGLRPHWVWAAKMDQLDVEEITRDELRGLGYFVYPTIESVDESARIIAQQCGLNFDELPEKELIAA